MAVALRPDVATTTADEAVEAIWGAVVSGEHKTVADAARAMWHGFRFSDDELSFLALYGLIQKANDDQRHTRSLTDGDGGRRPAIGYGAPHGKKQWAKYLALTWTYKNAAGEQLPLLEFTVVDLDAFAARTRKLAESYEARADWAESAQALLVQHGVEHVRQLPSDVLESLNASCGEVFSS